MSDLEAVRDAIQSLVDTADDPNVALNNVQSIVSELRPIDEFPIDDVKFVPLEKVSANSYNPNQVSDNEMELLYKSIKADGYTQPVVCVEDETYDGDETRLEIIDGFHRYITMKRHSDIRERSNGLLPITVLDKTMNEQRAATVRHNRASGKHTTSGKSQVVFEMLQDGWDDERICEELGMEPEELARLKHTSGFAKLFDDTDYSQPWKATEQLQVEKEFDEIDHPLSDESW